MSARINSPELYPHRSDWTRSPTNSAFREAYRKNPAGARDAYQPAELRQAKTSSSLDSPFTSSHAPVVDRTSGTSRLIASSAIPQARRDEAARHLQQHRPNPSRTLPAGTKYSAAGGWEEWVWLRAQDRVPAARLTPTLIPNHPHP